MFLNLNTSSSISISFFVTFGINIKLVNRFVSIKEQNQIMFKGLLKPATFNIPGNISSQFITGLLFGSISTFIIGGISSLLSFLVMYYIYKKETNKLNIITISIIGGFIHINTQLIIIGLIYNIGKEIYIYGFILIFISFITSIINGLITKRLNKVIYIK